MRPEPRYRQIFLYNDIDDKTVGEIMTTIVAINADDDEKEKEYIDWVRTPIYLYIMTNGGEAYCRLALVDFMLKSKTPVYTVSLGKSMSAGLWIFMAGKRRFIGEHSTLMFHDVTGYVWDKTEGMKTELTESLRLADMYCDFVSSRSKVTKEQLKYYIERKTEWYIPAQEAISLGLSHEYYKG